MFSVSQFKVDLFCTVTVPHFFKLEKVSSIKENYFQRSNHNKSAGTVDVPSLICLVVLFETLAK